MAVWQDIWQTSESCKVLQNGQQWFVAKGDLLGESNLKHRVQYKTHKNYTS
jgi:hypothetical protein